jgi:predicted transport protein
MYELMPNIIDLVRYRRFGDDHLLLERITTADTTPQPTPAPSAVTKSGADKPFSQWLSEADASTKALYESLKEVIKSQGEDVSEKETKLYHAFKRTRNFATVCYANKTAMNLYLHLDPDDIDLREGLRDVRSIGHWGTGSLEVRIRNEQDVEAAKPLIAQAYEGGAG